MDLVRRFRASAVGTLRAGFKTEGSRAYKISYSCQLTHVSISHGDFPVRGPACRLLSMVPRRLSSDLWLDRWLQLSLVVILSTLLVDLGRVLPVVLPG
eukprot:scaffold19638_cov68-Phaeocystis_antarctica.AAC.7